MITKIDDDIEALLYDVWLQLKETDQQNSAFIFIKACEYAIALQELRDDSKEPEAQK